MQKKQVTQEIFNRDVAKKAARAAAEDMVRQNKRQTGLFALYTWGSLAFVSAMVAIAAVLFQAGLGNKDIVVQKEAPGLGTVSIVGISEDAMRQPETEPLPENTAVNLPVDKLTTGSIAQPKEPVAEREIAAVQTSPAAVFGVDIGHSNTDLDLLHRYVSLKRRAPDLFEAVAPRLQRNEDGSTNVRLIAGPFSSKSEVSTFCRSVKLRLTIECSAAPYAGESIETRAK